jgi:hypothetical protein
MKSEVAAAPPIARNDAPPARSSALPFAPASLPFCLYHPHRIVMTFLGIELRRPSFNEVTAATIMAVGLWVAALGIAKTTGHSLQAHDAGALLIVAIWGCIGTRLGCGVAKGGRHLAAHVGVSAALLGLYQGALLIAG